jgi:hypothetical protein
MSNRLVHKSSMGLRTFGPYLLLEVLLPGGTLLALLLWLSQRFNRAGFGGVHQYLLGQITFKTVVAAKPDPRSLSLCLGRGHTAVLSPGRNGLRQICEPRTAAIECCA